MKFLKFLFVFITLVSIGIGTYFLYVEKINPMIEDPDNSEGSKNAANLTGLTITGGTLETEFDADVTNYIATVEYHATNSITVTANPTKAEDAKFALSNITSVIVNAQNQIKAMNITVIAPDEVTSKTYTINVVMKGFIPSNDENNNANLIALTVTKYADGGKVSAKLSPNFDPEITSYLVTVNYHSTTSTVIEAHPTKPDDASYDSSNITNVTVSATNQVKTMQITVLDSGGIVKKTYVITVVMLAPVPGEETTDNSIGLSNLTLTNATLNPIFSTNISSYVALVSYQETGSVTVNANPTPVVSSSIDVSSIISTTVSTNAPVNHLTINVVGSDGETMKSYLITVVMVCEIPNPNPPSTNASLNDLQLTGASLNEVFHPDITSYIATVPYQATGELSIIASIYPPNGATQSPNNINSVTVSATNPVDTIIIKLIAQDGKTTKTYTIHVVMLANSLSTWDGTTSYAFSQGNGTPTNPYEISGGSELSYLASLINTGNSTYNSPSVYYKLSNNIYLNDTTNISNWDTNAPANSWTPIGNLTNGFIANFDGDNFIIEGLYINEDSNNLGLFGVVGGTSQGGTIENVTILNSFINGKNYIGGVIGHIGANNTIHSISAKINVPLNASITPFSVREAWVRVENITNYATVVGSGEFIGGITGGLIATEIVQVINCTNFGDVTGSGNVGGIVGYTRGVNKVEIINSSNTGTIIGGNASYSIIYEVEAQISGGTGGVVGTIVSGNSAVSGEGFIDVNNCFNTGSVTGKNYTGGVVGLSALLGGYDPILNSYNLGDVVGENYVGGIAGYIYAPGNFGVSSDWILNNYNTGTVTGTYNLGGIAGYFGPSYKIVNCYSTGEVISTSTTPFNIGAIAGAGSINKSTQTSEIKNCYYRNDLGLNASGDDVIILTDNTTFNQTTGSLTTSINGQTTLLAALNYWVNNIAGDYGTVLLENGGKYLQWTNSPMPEFIPSQALPSA